MISRQGLDCEKAARLRAPVSAARATGVFCPLNAVQAHPPLENRNDAASLIERTKRGGLAA